MHPTNITSPPQPARPPAKGVHHSRHPTRSVWKRLRRVFRFLIQLYGRTVEAVFLATWTIGMGVLCLFGAALAFWLVAMGVAAVLHR